MALVTAAVVLTLVLASLVVAQLGGSERSSGGASAALAKDASRSSTPTTTPAAATTAVTSTPVSTAEAQQAATQAVEACRLTNLRQQASLNTAAVSLTQFGKHIDAMNLLVAGKISLAVARDFWNSSRIAATQNAGAFRSTDKGFTGSAVTCATLTPGLASTAGGRSAKTLATCAAAVNQRNGTLRAARTAVTTWEHHIHDMEMFRGGMITPAQATALWRRTWKTGDGQLKAYEVSRGRSARTGCPLT